MLKDRENKFEIVFLKKLIFLFFYCYNILILKIIFLKNTWQHPTDPSRRKMDDGIGQQCPLHHIPFGFDIIKYCSR